jgi:hypothetical protein
MLEIGSRKWIAYLFAVVFPLVLEEVGGTVEALQANVALMFPTTEYDNNKKSAELNPSSHAGAVSSS